MLIFSLCLSSTSPHLCFRFQSFIEEKKYILHAYILSLSVFDSSSSSLSFLYLYFLISSLKKRMLIFCIGGKENVFFYTCKKNICSGAKQNLKNVTNDLVETQACVVCVILCWSNFPLSLWLLLIIWNTSFPSLSKCQNIQFCKIWR